jgi:hypothetical protein
LPSRDRPTSFEAWIPGALVNPLNESAWGLWKHRRRVKTLREKAQACLLEAIHRTGWNLHASSSKRITFTRVGFNAMDSDGYQAAVKPYRDALMDMAVIDDDRDSAGHIFVYEQTIRRTRGTVAGVSIRVEPRYDPTQITL